MVGIWRAGPGFEHPPLTKPPYTVSWNTLWAENGPHVITAIARDAVGNESHADVTVTVTNDRTPPAVRLVSPAAGSTLSGTVTLTAAPAAVHAVLGVYFKVDGNRVGSPATAPYRITWNSNSVPDGTHVLSVAVLDATGAVAVSAGVTVDVRNRK